MKKLFLVLCLPIHFAVAQTQGSDRQLWLHNMDRIAGPVLTSLAEGKLKEKMPIVLSKYTDNATQRAKVAYLEAFGRTLCGMAPWLNGEGGSKDEVDMRNRYRQLSLKAIANAVNPLSKDYMLWEGSQPLVDASFLAFGMIRCPWLWDHLDATVKQQLIAALKTTRAVIPVYSNWILFSAMIEAFFCKYGLEYDVVRIEYAIREFAHHWYIGDGVFSDGLGYRWDYYNSIVIHPELACILDVIKSKTRAYDWFVPRLDTINKRYAVLLERHIHTDGSYPVTGRSIVYRGAVFHHLSDISLRRKLPQSLGPAQVRGALTAVIKRTLESPFTFTKDGWLEIGLYGGQPGLADVYITTGSLYICMNIFTALGLPETDQFWSAPAEPWTSVKVWSGIDVPADHALELK
jgi:hypothetical protein